VVTSPTQIILGRLAAQGDTVKIIKEPEISVSSYARGTQVNAQDLDDEDFLSSR
jgi:hypothetical protein